MQLKSHCNPLCISYKTNTEEASCRVLMRVWSNWDSQNTSNGNIGTTILEDTRTFAHREYLKTLKSKGLLQWKCMHVFTKGGACSTISDNQTQEAAQMSTHGTWHGDKFIPGMLMRMKTL